MINEKEQFVLALKGWKYKGILEDYEPHFPEAWALMGTGITGVIPDTMTRVTIPRNATDRRERIDGETVLFLTDHTYYILGEPLNG